MKLPFTIYDLRFAIWKKSGRTVTPLTGTGMRGVTRLAAFNRQSSIINRQFRAAFTMVEIAICLAIIGIALVAIIGVLPIGMRAQRDNREKTIINQDSTVFMNAIRNGARSADDLTNYVYAITNYQTQYPPGTVTTPMGYGSGYLTNGASIVGLLSTPEYTDANFAPVPGSPSGGYSNHIVAYVRSISGPAVEKPPQDNPILQQDSFSYHLVCGSVPVQLQIQTNGLAYAASLQANLYELRLTFLWPQLPNGNLSPSSTHQTYRTLVAGQLAWTTNSGPPALYFFQPQSFTAASAGTNGP